MKTKYVYPSTEIETIDCGVMDMTQKLYHKGMSLREHYAGVAMQGIIASTQGIGLEINDKHIETIAKKSVMYADELLKALLKT